MKNARMRRLTAALLLAVASPPAAPRRRAQCRPDPRRRPRLRRRRRVQPRRPDPHTAPRSAGARGDAVHRRAYGVGGVHADALRPADGPLSVALPAAARRVVGQRRRPHRAWPHSPWRRCSATRAITPPASASGISGCAGPPARARRLIAPPTPRRRRSTGSITADASPTGRPITASPSSSACRRRSTCATTSTSTATASTSRPRPRSPARRRPSRPFTARAGRARRSGPSACSET